MFYFVIRNSSSSVFRIKKSSEIELNPDGQICSRTCVAVFIQIVQGHVTSTLNCEVGIDMCSQLTRMSSLYPLHATDMMDTTFGTSAYPRVT